MSGLELAKIFYQEKGAPMIAEKFPNRVDRIAAGLVGEGSECFGFDDEISRDHDWGPSFCLWLTAADYNEFGAELNAAYKALMEASFMDYPPRREGPMSSGRVGVNEVGDFYKRYTGLDRAPKTLNEWRAVSEEALAMVTNGEVFRDPVGVFSQIREELRLYYPEDIRLKKLAAATAKAARAGQYNYPRALKRGDSIAANQALASFIENAVHVFFLLNKKYMPYSKWYGRGLLRLSVAGKAGHELFTGLTAEPPADMGKFRIDTVEAICGLIVAELKAQGLTNHSDPYLLAHSEIIQSHMSNESYRQLHIMAE